VTGAGPGDEDRVGVVEPPCQAHPPQVAGDVERPVLARLDVDDQPVGRVAPGELLDVAEPCAREHRHRLDAPADQPAGRVDVADARVEQEPPAGCVERELGRAGVVLPPVEARGPMVRRCALGQGRPGRLSHDVEPRQERRGYPVGGVHEVLPVQRRDPRHGRDRQEQRRQVRVPDQPGRLGRRDRVEVDMRQDLHRELPAPRRHDGPDRRVHEHRRQLGGAVPGRCADDAGTVHAGADHHVVPPGAQVLDAEVQPGPEVGLHPGRG
jgi:hypothetical protein